MSDLVGNPEDRFFHNEAHIIAIGEQLKAFIQSYCVHGIPSFL